MVLLRGIRPWFFRPIGGEYFYIIWQPSVKPSRERPTFLRALRGGDPCGQASPCQRHWWRPSLGFVWSCRHQQSLSCPHLWCLWCHGLPRVNSPYLCSRDNLCRGFSWPSPSPEEKQNWTFIRQTPDTTNTSRGKWSYVLLQRQMVFSLLLIMKFV